MARFRMMSVTSLQASARTVADAEDDRWTGCVSVIVPVYNEAAHVDELLRAIHASPVKNEIIIVDDGSSDGTREKLQAMPLAGDVTVVFHEMNCGKARPSVRRSNTLVGNTFSFRIQTSSTIRRTIRRCCSLWNDARRTSSTACVQTGRSAGCDFSWAQSF